LPSITLKVGFSRISVKESFKAKETFVDTVQRAFFEMFQFFLQTYYMSAVLLFIVECAGFVTVV
jgi:hypothetical protein